MNIRQSVISAVYAARENRDRPGYMHHTHVMRTATRVNFWGDTVGIWSAL